jgi:His/Glu/Gln/Arg/opine family amino acid ABC transporter permease subunit
VAHAALLLRIKRGLFVAEYYELWSNLIRNGEDVSFIQEFFVKFYQAFIEADRWKQYLSGVGTTLLVTAMALAIGVVLGILVAMIRTAHDQQRPGKHNFFLGILNAICKVYVTVIRGTPMMVQLLIMGLVVFSSSRNFTMVGALTLGINSGAYTAEIIRGGLMALDPGQMEAGRSLGLNYIDTMRFIVIPQAFKAILPSLGNEFIVLLKDTSLITVIGGKELVYAAQGIYTRTYEQMYPLIGIALIYLVIVMILSALLNILERRLRQGDRR